MQKRIVAVAAVAALLFTSSVLAAGKISADKGKELFNDPKLGNSKNESSCTSCHADGKGLEKAGENKKLTKLINNCLVTQMEGEKIDGRTASMRSLKVYIKSFDE
jgi:cytochrome c553